MLHVYNLATGLFTGVCFDVQPRTPEVLAANTPDGCGLVDAPEFDHAYARVVNGRVIPFLPSKPEDTAMASYVLDAGRWVRKPTLALLQLRKWQEVKNARDADIDAPTLDTPYGVIDADPKSRAAVTEVLSDWPEGVQAVVWTLHNNQQVLLDRASLSRIAELLFTRKQNARAAAQALRDRIFASETADQLEDIHWPR